MKMELGIDLGNGYVNFEDMRFASRVHIGETDSVLGLQEEVHVVSYKDEKYLVGKGQQFLGEERYKDEKYKLCLLTAIAVASGKKNREIEATICVGLPINLHTKNNKPLKELVETWRNEVIEVDGTIYVITIDSCTVFVEGAYGVLNVPKSTALTLDVGAGTVNVIEWNKGAKVFAKTYPLSFNKLCSEVMDYLNDKFSAGIKDTKKVEDYIGKKFMPINQKETDISRHWILLDNFVRGILTDIEKDFTPSAVAEIVVSGGGVIPIRSSWEKVMPTAEVLGNEESQFVNAKIYKTVLKAMKQNG